jgi:RNA polymerase sigma factor (sigma-70 family)
MGSVEQAERAEWLRSVLDRYEGPLTRFAARLIGDVERARDVVQETFLRLCRDGAPRDDAHTPRWLFTVCRRLALDVRRKEKRMRPLAEEHERVAAARAFPAAAAEGQESAGSVLAVLAGLPSRQQEVIRLRFQNGLSYRDIAAVMDTSVTNVGYLIHSAIATLRQRMMPGDDGRSRCTS